MGWRDDLMATYNAQNFLPEMGLEAGFSPLTDLGIEDMAGYTNVNTEKTDFLNYLATLQALPQANADWSQGGTRELGDLPWLSGQMTQQNTPDGSAAFGIPTDYLGEGEFGNFNWRPKWADLHDPESQGGIGYDSFSQGMAADPNYNPASLSGGEYSGGFGAGSYDPAFTNNINLSSDLFNPNKSDQWADVVNVDSRWGQDYSPLLGQQFEQLGSAMGENYNYAPSYIDTGWQSNYKDMKMPAGGSTGCVLPGTRIETQRGPQTIENTDDFDEIKIYDFETGEFGYSPIKKILWTEVDGWCEIETSSGKKLKCSNSHLMYHPDYKNSAVATDKLGVGGELYAVNDDGEIQAETIVSIDVHDEKVDVWNYELEVTHNYISNGILSHNATAKNMPHMTSGALADLPRLLQSKNIFDSGGVYGGDTTQGPYGEIEKWQKYFNANPNTLLGAGQGFATNIPGGAEQPLLDYTQKMSMGASGDDATGLAQAWNYLPQAFPDSSRGLSENNFYYMPEGGDLINQHHKAAINDYMKRGLKGFDSKIGTKGFGRVADDVGNMLSDYLVNDWSGKFGPDPSVVKREDDRVIAAAYADVEGSPLAPRAIKNVQSGDIGMQEAAASKALQDAWNKPGSGSIQGIERDKRQALQEYEMAALNDYQNYRRDQVVGDELTGDTLLGDIADARTNAWNTYGGAGGIRDTYQGVSGTRPASIEDYDDFLSSRISSTDLGPGQYNRQRADEIDLYKDKLYGSGTNFGLQAQLDADIANKYYQYRTDTGGDGSLESLENKKWTDAFDTSKLAYTEGLADLVTDYEADEKVLQDIRSDALGVASKEWKTAQRELDQQMADTGDTSRLRRDIRGFVGGNILSGRRERRANEERASALGSRAELINQQKKITGDRREAQRKARAEWRAEQDALFDRTELSATDLFEDVEDTLQPIADDVETQLGIHQNKMSEDLVGSPTSTLNTAVNTKAQEEAGTEANITTIGTDIEGSITDETTPSNYADTLGALTNQRTSAMDLVTGVGGVQPTYETAVDSATQTALNRGVDAMETASNVGKIPEKRATYLDAIGGPTGEINTLGNTITSELGGLGGQYGKYTTSPYGGWGKDLKNKYLSGSSASNIPQGLAGNREAFAEQYSEGLGADVSTGGPWAGGDPDWTPSFMRTPRSGGETLNKAVQSLEGSGKFSIFGTDYTPVLGWKNIGGSGMQMAGQGFGRKDITPTPYYNPNNKWWPFDYYGWEWPSYKTPGWITDANAKAYGPTEKGSGDFYNKRT